MTADSDVAGRLSEMRRIRFLVDRLPLAGGALLLQGEAGIGKTTLGRAAVDRAGERAIPTMTITAPESEAGIPYAALQQMFQPHQERLSAMRARPRSVIERAFGQADGETPTVFAVAIAALELMVDVADDRGLLVLVDDAHWLDESSAQVLGFVARRISTDPVGLVFALRSGHSSPLLQANLETVVVDALDDVDSRNLLRRRRPGLSRSDAAALIRLAQGNPLALIELGTTSENPGVHTLSERLEATFLARLTGVRDTTRTVLLLAALADGGSIGELGSAALEAGIVGAAFSDAIDEAVRSGTVAIDDGELRFQHPLVRSALVSSSTPVAIRASHAALAAALPDDDRATWHRAHAAAAAGTRNDPVGDALESAALRALAQGDVATGHRAFALAANLAATSGVAARRRLRSAQMALELGRVDLAESAIASTDTSVLSIIDAARLALVQLTVASTALDPRRLERLLEHGRRALDAGDLDLAISICLAVGEHLDAGGHTAHQAASPLAMAIAAHFSEDDPRRLVILASVDPGPYIQRISGAIARIDPVARPATAELLLRVRSNVDADRGLAELQRRLLDAYRSRGQLRSIAFLQPAHAWIEITLANWPEALRSAEEGTRLAIDVGAPRWGTGTLIAEAYIAAIRGDHERADQFIEESERGATLAGANNVLTGVQLTKGLNHVAQGRYEDAFFAFLRPFDSRDPSHHPVQKGWMLGDLAEVAAHVGRVDEIRSLFEGDPSVPTTPWQTMAEAYAQPFLVTQEQDVELAFEDALGGVVSQWPTYRARLLLEYGSWLRRHGQIVKARLRLRACVEMFDALTMAPWSERARRELRAAGDEAATRTPAAWEALSAQELQVAELAAKGLSNREIGEKLFLSHRTVGSHLYRAFPKLGVTNRAQLASLLGSDEV